MSYPIDWGWVVEKIQPIAVEQVYSNVWPQCKIIALDSDRGNELKRILDISGADKLLRYPDGGVSFLAQRFRRGGNHDDFTLRRHRPSGRKTEAYKVLAALRENRLLAAFYAYGHVNQSEDGFLRFRILDFISFLQAWESGELIPDGWRMNKDNSSSFYHWRFGSIPMRFFVYNTEPMQLSFLPPSPARPAAGVKA